MVADTFALCVILKIVNRILFPQPLSTEQWNKIIILTPNTYVSCFFTKSFDSTREILQPHYHSRILVVRFQDRSKQIKTDGWIILAYNLRKSQFGQVTSSSPEWSALPSRHPKSPRGARKERHNAGWKKKVEMPSGFTGKLLYVNFYVLYVNLCQFMYIHWTLLIFYD